MRKVLLVIFTLAALTSCTCTPGRGGAVRAPDPVRIGVSVDRIATAAGNQQEIANPLEALVAGTPRLVRLESASTHKEVRVTLELSPDVDPAVALEDVRNRLSASASYLPPDASVPILRRIQPEWPEMIRYSLRSSTLTLTELAELGALVAAEGAKNAGVVRTPTCGGREEEVRIRMDSVRAKAFDVTPMQVATVLEHELSNRGSTLGPNVIEALTGVRLAMKGDAPIFVRDVANVEIGGRLPPCVSFYDGAERVVGALAFDASAPPLRIGEARAALLALASDSRLRGAKLAIEEPVAAITVWVQVASMTAEEQIPLAKRVNSVLQAVAGVMHVEVLTTALGRGAPDEQEPQFESRLFLEPSADPMAVERAAFSALKPMAWVVSTQRSQLPDAGRRPFRADLCGMELAHLRSVGQRVLERIGAGTPPFPARLHDMFTQVESVVPDRQVQARLGVTAVEIAQAIRLAHGEHFARVKVKERALGVRVLASPPSPITDLLLNGGVRLSEVAKIRLEMEPLVIRHVDRQRCLAITGETPEANPEGWLEQRRADIQANVALPAGMVLRWREELSRPARPPL